MVHAIAFGEASIDSVVVEWTFEVGINSSHSLGYPYATKTGHPLDASRARVSCRLRRFGGYGGRSKGKIEGGISHSSKPIDDTPLSAPPLYPISHIENH